MTRFFRLLKYLGLGVGLVVLVGVGYATKARWLPILVRQTPTEEKHDHTAAIVPSEQVLLSTQAQKNLRLKAKPLQPETFWKTRTIPGLIVDRPGASDRGVVSPTTALVSAIHFYPGDTVLPDQALFTVKLLSETLHLTQTELFKATQDVQLIQATRKRLVDSAGAVAESRIIDLDNQLARLATASKGYRQELLNRGLTQEQITEAAGGKLVTELVVRAPSRPVKPLSDKSTTLAKSEPPLTYEVQELKVELGQQVQAGQTLCLLANHHLLAIEGRAFREETSLLERAVRENWSIDIDFQEDPQAGWEKKEQPFEIRYISNTIDPATRTFTFLIPFENQARPIDQDGRTLMLWRYRPGHQVRLDLRIEKLEKSQEDASSKLSKLSENLDKTRNAMNAQTASAKPLSPSQKVRNRPSSIRLKARHRPSWRWRKPRPRPSSALLPRFDSRAASKPYS